MPGRNRRGAAGFTTSPVSKCADTMETVPPGQAEIQRKLRNSAAPGLAAPGATYLSSPAPPRNVRSERLLQPRQPPAARGDRGLDRVAAGRSDRKRNRLNHKTQCATRRP